MLGLAQAAVKTGGRDLEAVTPRNRILDVEDDPKLPRHGHALVERDSAFRLVHVDAEISPSSPPKAEIPQLEPVVADQDQISRVCEILLDNAIKYTPHGGAVTLGAREHGDRVEVRVQDDGPGIPEPRRPRVFEKFYRGVPSGARGSGLGLAIASAIVRQHEGEIGVECPAEGGSVFWFTLPRQAAARGRELGEGRPDARGS